MERSMMIALSTRNKLKLVNGKFEELKISSPKRAYWKRENDMIISWVLNTVSDWQQSQFCSLCSLLMASTTRSLFST